MESEGEALKKIIKEKGYTQDEFAKLLGVDRTYLSSLLQRDTLPRNHMKKALEILKIDMEMFKNMSIHILNRGGSGNRGGDAASLLREIELLKEIIKTKDQLIDNLKEQLTKK